jgi:uncharacterized protein
MTPQEKELISSLMGRLKKVGAEPKDAEAEALIRQAMAEQPDAPYQLVQTVLIQDMALNQAQSRIADLERQLADAKARTQPVSSFLGGLAAGTGAAMPPFGPWGQPVPQPANQPGHGPGGGYARPDYASPAPPAPPAPQDGFLRSAATTAAGVAGGALLFEGIQSMFGHHADGILNGVAQQPAITETVVNNYYYGDDLSDPGDPGDPQDFGSEDVDTGQDFQGDDGVGGNFGGTEDI